MGEGSNVCVSTYCICWRGAWIRVAVVIVAAGILCEVVRSGFAYTCAVFAYTCAVSLACIGLTAGRRGDACQRLEQGHYVRRVYNCQLECWSGA